MRTVLPPTNRARRLLSAMKPVTGFTATALSSSPVTVLSKFSKLMLMFFFPLFY